MNTVGEGHLSLPSALPLEEMYMDYCFENVGKADARAIIEMRYRIGPKVYYVLAGAYLLLGIHFLLEFLAIFFYAGAIYFLLLPCIQVKRGMKKELKFHQGVLPTNTARFWDKISIENEMASRNWEYKHLTGVYSFKYSYCLRFADKTVLLLGRDGFTKGTFEEFKQFLREKRPDLKIPE